MGRVLRITLFLAAGLAYGQFAPTDSYRVVAAYPHDRGAYTQGLQFINGALYEGTGLNGRSSIRQVDLQTGRVARQQALSSLYFGEGITILGNRLFQLTWQNGIGFVYDLATFRQSATFRYTGEGWGLTHDGTNLIMSDGTADLRFIDPVRLSEVRRVQVHDNAVPVWQINELEFIEGEIWANVYQTHRVARINPANGKINSWVDLRGLLSEAERSESVDVLNGIAYDAAGKRIFVTGKLWPKLFHIQVVPGPRK